MKALSVFGIVFGLITLGTGIYTMNIDCNCVESADSLFQYNNETNDRISGSGWAMVFSGIFFLVFSIITAIVFFNSKKPAAVNSSVAQPMASANWQGQQQQRQQYQQPQGYANWPPQNYPPSGYPPQNNQWPVPPAPQQQQWTPPPAQTPPPPQQQWTPPPAQTPPPPPPGQETPPPASWQQPPADDVNRWAPKRDNNPTDTPPAN
jgi:hypothetical protein